MNEKDEELYAFAKATCIQHGEEYYVADRCGYCDEEAFEAYMEDCALYGTFVGVF